MDQPQHISLNLLCLIQRPSSFFSALQLGVSFDLLNNLPPFFSPSEADYVVSEQFSFCGVRLLASRSTPNLED
jgi:hypothetical protein